MKKSEELMNVVEENAVLQAEVNALNMKMEELSVLNAKTTNVDCGRKCIKYVTCVLVMFLAIFVARMM
ncbi:MAG: hypothetical protein Q8807_02635 ['Waltheria sp.' little leaf phytoplasma]|nr:hypothetical protein ['Waltheria sp.' little leaf phytoplasma]